VSASSSVLGMLCLLIAGASALTDSRPSGSVKCASVQVGGKGSKPGDLHARFEQDLRIGKLRTHLVARFRHPNTKRMLDTVSLVGVLGDVAYEATRDIGGDESTDVQLAYAVPSGVQVTAGVKVRPTGSPGERHIDIERLSAFHTAGPVNIEPSWLLTERALRVKLGRGLRCGRMCPFTLQTELRRDGTPATYELTARHEPSEGRKFQASLLLPGVASARQVCAEYQDATIDKGATWFAKAAVSGEQGRAPELSLRRAWHF